MSLLLRAFATNTSREHSFRSLLTHSEWVSVSMAMCKGRSGAKRSVLLGLRGWCAEQTLLHCLAALLIDEAQVEVLVAEIP
jgi:hypothetical protein